jgi:hypothetical protein
MEPNTQRARNENDESTLRLKESLLRLWNREWLKAVAPERDVSQSGDPAALVESLALLAKLAAQGPEAGSQSPVSPSIPSLETGGKGRVGPPARYRSLTVFPLFGDDSPAVECLLFDEALSAGVVTVSEVSA